MCKVVIYNYVFCWLLFRAKFDCNFIQSYIPCIYWGICLCYDVFCMLIAVKLLFTTICFVGLYFVSNLIVIIYNLLYPVFIVGFLCKVCVIERECVKTQAIED